jgi:16S rRNA (adenine1518-N6/adenine1519-N6)-dimethyltransferase
MASSGKYCVDHSVTLPKLDIARLLREYGLHPDKSLGQNFLVDESALQKVVEAAVIHNQDVVLEIGAGLGSLTRLLAARAQRVIAVEIDRILIPALKSVVWQFPNVQIVEGDILAYDPSELVYGADYLVVANIPYYITSSLIRHLLEGNRPPSRVVLTVQREVAERICAGQGDMSLLALSVQVYGHPVIVARLPAGAFYPPPKVDSAVIRIDLFASPLIPAEKLDVFFQLTKAGFSQKRKTLRNALAGGLRLPPSSTATLLAQAKIDPMRRAETLCINEWHQLVNEYCRMSVASKVP